jgi:uncharacterized Rmd1/YagE family protein
MTKKKTKTSRKPSPATTDKRTKAELRIDLEEAERELEKARALTSKLEDDKSRLSKKLGVEQKKARTEAEEFKATRIELRKKRQALGKENQDLRIRLETLEKENKGLKRVIAELPPPEKEAEPKPSLDIGLPQQASRGEAELPPEIPTTQETQASGRGEHAPDIFESISFEQAETRLESGRSLRANVPFSVHVKLHLPTIPTARNTDVDHPTYAVQVKAKEEKSDRVVSNDAAGLLSFGIADYESDVDMPGLDSGKYLLSFSGIAPFARIAGSKQVELTVL